MHVQLTEKQAEWLRIEQQVEVNNIVYVVVDEGKWRVEPKGQSKEIVFSEKGMEKTGPYFMLPVYKTGSDYTDWFYEYFDHNKCMEVERKTKVITKVSWQVKK